MKTTGVSCVPKFGLLFFLGHLTYQALNLYTACLNAKQGSRLINHQLHGFEYQYPVVVWYRNLSYIISLVPPRHILVVYCTCIFWCGRPQLDLIFSDSVFVPTTCVPNPTHPHTNPTALVDNWVTKSSPPPVSWSPKELLLHAGFI